MIPTGSRGPFKVYEGGKSSSWGTLHPQESEAVWQELQRLTSEELTFVVLDSVEDALVDTVAFQKAARRYSILMTTIHTGQSVRNITRSEGLLQGEISDPSKEKCPPSVGGNLYTFYMEYYWDILGKLMARIEPEVKGGGYAFMLKLLNGSFYEQTGETDEEFQRNYPEPE